MLVVVVLVCVGSGGVVYCHLGSLGGWEPAYNLVVPNIEPLDQPFFTKQGGKCKIGRICSPILFTKQILDVVPYKEDTICTYCFSRTMQENCVSFH
jgi:hypothetical protein